MQLALNCLDLDPSGAPDQIDILPFQVPSDQQTNDSVHQQFDDNKTAA